MNHTPTPWSQGGHEYDETHGRFEHQTTYDDHVYDALGGFIFQVVAGAHDDAGQLTATIVRACNAHDELVIAAEKARRLIAKINVHGKHPDVVKEVQHVMDALNPILNNLAKAEGK